MADTSDYVRGGLFIVAFLLTGIWDLKRWFMADLVFTSMSGLYIYINPTWSINLQTKGIKVDDLHGHLNRVFAAFLIGPVLIWLFCRKSKDRLIISAMLQSRTLSILLLIVVMSFGQLSYGKIFSDKHFWFGFLGNILWWLANVIQLIKNDQGPIKVNMLRGVALTIISRLNLIFLTLGAITYLTSPEQTIEFVKNKKLDNYHIHTARAIGAMMTGLVVFSWYIPRFKEKKSIRVVFLGQLLVSA
ncbi:hypothetical protein KUTeg_010328 [Tegillarca granosa]|uniref:DUF5009 domain-containing protein n=1 Tax=Tegillarca granosa TaxID=220873 RepID=A0ABQ9F9I8_TEGGR|nr:hypothetical protein KUTeg_010328 [Tegillarca granosa]